METIKNYLETMFSPLPNNAEVLRAKDELLSMMEDKYNGLMEEGMSSEEAVAKVIAECGSLDDIASELGIQEAVVQTKDVHRRNVSLEEAEAFLADSANAAIVRTTAICIFILSVVPPIIFSEVAEYTVGTVHNAFDALGAVFFFIFIATGVGMIIVENGKMKKWNFLRKEPCQLDYSVLSVIDEKYKAQEGTFTSRLAIGVCLCIVSVVPIILVDALGGLGVLEDLAGAFIFAMVAAGVGFILMASYGKGAYKTLLSTNGDTTVGGNQFDSQKDEAEYSDPTIAAIMSVYWETVLCIYLSWSFLTFNWFSTWIIWPIAAIIHALVKKLFKEEM